MNALIVELPATDSFMKLRRGDLVNDSILLTSLLAETESLKMKKIEPKMNGYKKAIHGTTTIDKTIIDIVR